MLGEGGRGLKPVWGGVRLAARKVTWVLATSRHTDLHFFLMLGLLCFFQGIHMTLKHLLSESCPGQLCDPVHLPLFGPRANCLSCHHFLEGFWGEGQGDRCLRSEGWWACPWAGSLAPGGGTMQIEGQDLRSGDPELTRVGASSEWKEETTAVILGGAGGLFL